MKVFTNELHLSEEALGLLVLGDLSPTNRKCVVAHLSECGSCVRRLSEAEDFIAMFKQLARRDSSHGIVSGRVVECANPRQHLPAAAL
jgi:anti-sigma factor RsiW